MSFKCTVLEPTELAKYQKHCGQYK